MKAYLIGLVASVVAIAALAGAADATRGPSSLSLVSPDGRSSITLTATNSGSFVVMTGPDGRMVSLFSTDAGGSQTGLAMYRDLGFDQAISIGVDGEGKADLTAIPAVE